jgi:membrane-bound metal-dependent hydrolase YbcI (DUF457 family)
MPGYRGHLTGGIFAYALYMGALAAAFAVDAAWQQLGLIELVAYPIGLLGTCLMFALWPDVDTNSKGQDVFYTIFFVADLMLIAARRFEEAAYLGLFAILPILGKHRGWTHTYWAMLLVPLPLVVLPYVLAPERPLSGLPFYGAAVVGYASHLLLDRIGLRRRVRARR